MSTHRHGGGIGSGPLSPGPELEEVVVHGDLPGGHPWSVHNVLHPPFRDVLQKLLWLVVNRKLGIPLTIVNQVHPGFLVHRLT